MKSHQQRVVTEKKELDTKLDALNVFISEDPTFKELPILEQARLKEQRHHMSAYSAVLGRRIEYFSE